MSGSDMEAIVGRTGRIIGYVTLSRGSNCYVVLDECYNFLCEARSLDVAQRILTQREFEAVSQRRAR